MGYPPLVTKPASGGESGEVSSSYPPLFRDGGCYPSIDSGDAEHDIAFTAGFFRDSTNTADIVVSALTKRLDATWSAGDNAGGLDAGSPANNTEYWFHAIWNPTSETGDFLISTSRTAPTLPSGFTKFRCVGWGKTDGDANWISFTSYPVAGGLVYRWTDPPEDSTTAATATAALVTLSVPTGISVLADLNVAVADDSGLRLYLSNPAVNDEEAGFMSPPYGNYTAGADSNFTVYSGSEWTNDSGQLRQRGDNEFNVTNIVTRGFMLPLVSF